MLYWPNKNSERVLKKWLYSIDLSISLSNKTILIYRFYFMWRYPIHNPRGRILFSFVIFVIVTHNLKLSSLFFTFCSWKISGRVGLDKVVRFHPWLGMMMQHVETTLVSPDSIDICSCNNSCNRQSKRDWYWSGGLHGNVWFTSTSCIEVSYPRRKLFKRFSYSYIPLTSSLYTSMLTHLKNCE